MKIKNDEDVTHTFHNSNLIYDITNWDVSNVTDMRYMFSDSKFNGNVSASIRQNAEIVEWIVNNPIIFEKVKNEFPEFFL